jgi:hypothetical protein
MLVVCMRGSMAMKRPLKRADKPEIALVPGREIALFTIGVVPMTEESKVELAVLALMAAAMTPNRRIVSWFVNRFPQTCQSDAHKLPHNRMDHSISTFPGCRPQSQTPPTAPAYFPQLP